MSETLQNGITRYLLACLLPYILACLLTCVPVRGGEEDVARAQAVHVDDGVGGELHLLVEAEAPRRLGSSGKDFVSTSKVLSSRASY